MKKSGLIFLSLLTIFTIAKAQKVIKVGAFNFYPGIFQDTDGEVKGFYIDALTEIGKKENIEFVYVYGTWDEGLASIKNGDVDLLTSVAITEERLNFMDYTSTPLLTVWSEVYVTQNSEIRGILDLEGKTIAVMKSDINGYYLKQIAEKLAVNCSFVETADFEEVFKLISDKKADAGVVNNTFGAPKSQEYNLLSSGIVFNPFDIYFTVKKDANEELMKLLNKYLYDWKPDRNSVFNVARQKWSHGEIGAIEVFPKWLQKGIYSALLLVLILIIFIGLLRYKVRVATEKVKYSERLFKTFMENTPAYVYIKDTNLNHIYRNRMVNNVNNAAPMDKISSAKTVFEPQVVEWVEKTDAEILSSENKQLNLQYQCKLNGKNTWLHDYKFFLQLPDGKPGIGGISFDITKLKEAEFELIKAKEKAEESDRLKSAFLANMSHEIRTPLNSIVGFSTLISEKNNDAEAINKMKYFIDYNSNILIKTIDDIIDLSKIEADVIKFTTETINLHILLTNIYNYQKQILDDSKKVGLELHYHKYTDDIVLSADKFRLSQILNNLISNSIKYTEAGSIDFGFTIISNAIQFYVKDTGIGISKNEIANVFSRFYKVKGKYDTIRGVGLGLSIVKQLTEKMDGKIWVESEIETGSIFYFSFPYQKAKIATLAEQPKPISLNLKGKLVLVAEDDEGSFYLIKLLLKRMGVNVLRAENGLKAIEVCNKYDDIDFVLMDIKMPIMDGLEATLKIRESKKDLLIVALSAHVMEEAKTSAFNAGCNDFISKPIEEDRLLALLQKHIKN